MNLKDIKEWWNYPDRKGEFNPRVADRFNWLISEHTRLTSENATAYARGMSRAAEICSEFDKAGVPTRYALAKAILAAIPSTDREKGEERCEYQLLRTQNLELVKALESVGKVPSLRHTSGHFSECAWCNGSAVTAKEAIHKWGFCQPISIKEG